MSERFFNTSGPVRANRHYCLPPLHRLDEEEVLSLIGQERYFILHAPRQTGKTSCLLALRDQLNRAGELACIYINVEPGQAAREDVEAAMRAIGSQLASRVQITLGDTFLEARQRDIYATAGEHGVLRQMLTLLAQHCDKPIVLLVDEIDALVGDTLVAVLRQLRSGYDQRPEAYPQSIVLCGVRDIQDYRIQSPDGRELIAGGSAFNVSARSLRLGDFTHDDIAALYRQHTEETGQVWAEGVIDLVWELTQGQPWLVNALAHETTWELRPNRDRTRAITTEDILTAKENLIVQRVTHLDQLAHKLAEPRVRRVIEPLLSGTGELSQIPTDDIAYCRDLGLLRASGALAIANPIYREVIPRELTYSTQAQIVQEANWFLKADRQLDMPALLTAFQQFFREHSEHWVERFDYREAGPQLLLQAFLQRVINGGGRVEREYGLGRKRTDLLIIWPHPEGVQRIVLELKIRYGKLATVMAEGLAQTWEYVDRTGAQEAHLIIFDQTKRPWREKLYRKEMAHEGTKITAWGM
jgi:hypothetical protein